MASGGLSQFSVDKINPLRHKSKIAMHHMEGLMAGLKGLSEALAYLRKEASEELPIRHLEILVYVHNKSEVSVGHLAKDLNLPKSAVSVAVKRLSQFPERNTKTGNLEMKGLGLLDKERDPEYQTLVKIKLTPKGERIVKHLDEILSV